MTPPYAVGAVRLDSVFEFTGNPMPLDVMFAGCSDDTPTALSWRTWVLRWADVTMLVDTGLGNDKTRQSPIDFCDHLDTPFLGELAAAGLSPEDVDLVVCTHLHFDHVGWNTRLLDGAWVPTFPRARYLLPAADLAHFAVPEADPVMFPSYLDSVQPLVERGVVDPIPPDGATHELDGVQVTFEPVPGHSPGSTIVRVASGGRRVSFVGDLMHHPIQVTDPALSISIEEHPQQAAAQRARFLAEVADTDEMVAPAHFPGAGIGRVRRAPDRDGYEWEPA